MQIRKETQLTLGGEPNQGQLEAINYMAKTKLTKDQVYVFSVRLCDDQVDRDHERFDTAALPELAKLFIGKAGIVDHKWSAECQVARIFATEVVQEDGISYIKAWAYIRRGGKGDEWIADIEAGIKKEVSVGCAMGESVCSICGSGYGSCGHQKGEVYDGVSCCAILREPMDAYEFSFVAVPAQREAGVLKGMGRGAVTLKELAAQYGAQEEYGKLCKLAELGKAYTRQLEDEVVSLCLMLELDVEERVLRNVAKALGGEELAALKKALEKKSRERYPMQCQLIQCADDGEFESGFLI